MHHKLKNTLTGLVVALGMIGLGFTTSQAPQRAMAINTDAAPSPLIIVRDAADTGARKHAPSRKSGMVMPYFSFAPFLPKQES
jgi:hypothetical protein